MTAIGAIGWIAFIVTLVLWSKSDTWWLNYCRKSIAEWAALCEKMNDDWARFCMRINEPPSVRNVKPPKEPSC